MFLFALLQPLKSTVWGHVASRPSWMMHHGCLRRSTWAAHCLWPIKVREPTSIHHLFQFQLSFSSEIRNIISQISYKWHLITPLLNENLAHFEGLQCLLLKFILLDQLFVSVEFPVPSTCLSGFFLSVWMCQVSHNSVVRFELFQIHFIRLLRVVYMIMIIIDLTAYK